MGAQSIFLMKRFGITKADIILFVCIVLLGIASLFMLIKTPDSGSRVVITSDGKVVYDELLSSDTCLDIESKNGLNKVLVEGRRVCVTEADCSGKVCVSSGWISKEGQIIVCAPHNLVVSIEGENKTGGEHDAISY